MLRIAVIAIVATLSAIGAAKAVLALDKTHPAQAVAAEAQTTLPQAAAGPTDAAVIKAADGHYWAQATVDGKAVRFLVDTGATAVALTQEDALRLGFHPRPADYTYTVTTADGQTRAAPVKLSTVSIAGARVDNVDALVIEKGLGTSLLGMTYLGRLSRFEATQTSLILRP